MMSKPYLDIQDDLIDCRLRLQLLSYLTRDMPIVLDCDDFTDDMREDFRYLVAAEVLRVSERLDILVPQIASLRLPSVKNPVSD